eukprot:3559314-Rhodomonas_salina.3
MWERARKRGLWVLRAEARGQEWMEAMRAVNAHSEHLQADMHALTKVEQEADHIHIQYAHAYQGRSSACRPCPTCEHAEDADRHVHDHRGVCARSELGLE